MLCGDEYEYRLSSLSPSYSICIDTQGVLFQSVRGVDFTIDNIAPQSRMTDIEGETLSHAEPNVKSDPALLSAIQSYAASADSGTIMPEVLLRPNAKKGQRIFRLSSLESPLILHFNARVT